MKSGNLDTINFSKKTEKDKLKSSSLDKNCQTILNLLLEDLFCYPPSYEKLTGDLNGLYSRRINRQHRIIYEVNEEKHEIHILRMWTQYE